MVTIHSIEEMLNFYISLGGLREDAANGFRYVFPRQHSKIGVKRHAKLTHGRHRKLTPLEPCSLSCDILLLSH
ncbi:hypothetical protein FF3_00806 [Fretibacterium fastidiosum]